MPARPSPPGVRAPRGGQLAADAPAADAKRPSMETTFVSSYFTVRVSRGPGALIEVRGELDLCAVPAFEAVVGSLDLASVPRAVLDLRRLDFIDGAGLHAVLRLQAACLEVSTILTIVPGPWHVQ